jgi:hypothetical protein
MNQQKESKPYPYEEEIVKELEKAFPAVKHDWLSILRFTKERLCANCTFKEGIE